jgi:hypothetical protein
MLATSSHDGATQALLSAHGRDASLIASPVNEELVTLAAEMPVGGKLIAVAKAWTTHSPLAHCNLEKLAAWCRDTLYATASITCAYPQNRTWSSLTPSKVAKCEYQCRRTRSSFNALRIP